MIKNNCYIYFFLSLILYPIFMVIMEPNWLFSGEMWAEGATNYFYNSVNKDFWEMFFSTDAGYWAFVQRIIAAIAVILGLHISIVPYFYTWSAILLTPFFIAPICLPAFRKLISSDFLRFLLAISLLLIIDFETAVFINFTYYAVFLVLIITALAYAEGKNGSIPAWSWIIPLLIFTKPSIMATIPLMFLCAFFANKRFIHITIASIIAVIAQFIRLYISFANGEFQWAHNVEFSFVEKFLASIVIFFELLPITFFGILKVNFIFVGTLISLVLLFVVYKLYVRGSKNCVALIVAGTGLIYLNTLLLCYSIPAMWNLNTNVHLYVNRYMVVNIIGMFFIISAFTEIINEKKKYWGTAAFVLWFAISGFLITAIEVSKEAEYPLLYTSKWQKNYGQNTQLEAACVPISPIGWLYAQKNCRAINLGFATGIKTYYINYENDKYYLSEDLQNALFLIQAESVIINVIPQDRIKKNIETTTYIEFEDETTAVVNTSDIIGKNGGLVQIFIPQNNIKIKSLAFQFNTPVFINVRENGFPISMWLGKERTEK